MPPRIRMVAGPNGSGKSTLLSELSKLPHLPLGQLLNPDLLEAQLNSTRRMSLRTWHLDTTYESLRSFFQEHPLWPQIGKFPLKVQDDSIVISEPLMPGYFVAVLCDFMRRQWLKSGTSFTFETVMSGSDKPHLLHEAKTMGFRTYLYFVCTNSVLINQDRVSSRVLKGGHSVPSDKIIQRYDRTLSLLPTAIKNADRAFLFDNSETHLSLVAEFENNRLTRLRGNPPKWLDRAFA